MNRITEDIRKVLLEEFKRKEIAEDFECYLKAKHIFVAFSTLKHTHKILTQNQIYDIMDYLQLKEINLTNIKICKR